MKNLINLLTIPVMMFFFACGPENPAHDEIQSDLSSDTVAYYQESLPDNSQMGETPDPTEETISNEDIPQDISENIKKDEYLSTLTLDRAVKIKNNEQTYYELTFQDENNKIIAVIFDERGNKLTI